MVKPTTITANHQCYAVKAKPMERFNSHTTQARVSTNPRPIAPDHTHTLALMNPCLEIQPLTYNQCDEAPSWSIFPPHITHSSPILHSEPIIFTHLGFGVQQECSYSYRPRHLASDSEHPRHKPSSYHCIFLSPTHPAPSHSPKPCPPMANNIIFCVTSGSINICHHSRHDP